MENTRLLRAVLVLAVCFTIHITSGQAVGMSSTSNKTTFQKSEGSSRNESVEVGNNVTLHCTNEKIATNKMIYVIWKIYSQEKNCSITVATNDTDYDSCNDGKRMYISESGTYSLVIPRFSIKDEGHYTCDVSYEAGGYIESIHVSACVHPTLTGWLEKMEDGHTFAVCEARSKPEASIYWKSQWNTSSLRPTFKDASGLFKVTSQLLLPYNASSSDLTCVISSSSCNREEIQFNTFQNKDGDPSFSSITWPFILMCVIATCFIVTLLTVLHIMREKIAPLSVFRKLCCKPQIPTPAREEKTPQPRDPEEVEPYASYVQRVNSIYNSSAELFNA